MKTKILMMIGIVLVAMLIIGSVRYTQNEDGPHGGRVQKAGKYHVEMKNPFDAFYAFLLDENGNPISNMAISCDARFYYADETTMDVKLEKFEDDGFISMTVIPKYIACKVMFDVYGKTVESKFDNLELIVEEKH